MNYSRRVFRHRFLITRCFSFASMSLDPPPAIIQRRVVVTGLGMVTPLGCGVQTTWRRLIDGGCGIRALSLEDLKMEGFDNDIVLHTFEQLTSKVAAIVPFGTNEGEFNEELWLRSKVFNFINDGSVSAFVLSILMKASDQSSYV